MLQTAPRRDRAINFLSHKGTEAHQWAAWHSLTHSQRVSFLGLVLLFCNSFQSGVNFFFQSCITPPLPPSFCALRWWKAQKACVSDPCSPPGLADSCRRTLQHLLQGAVSLPGDPLGSAGTRGCPSPRGDAPAEKPTKNLVCPPGCGQRGVTQARGSAAQLLARLEWLWDESLCWDSSFRVLLGFPVAARTPASDRALSCTFVRQ